MGYTVKGAPAPPRPEGAIEPDPALPRGCVIGAGSSGITAAKALYEARVPFDCFEMGPMVGGNWVFRNPNGQSACYSTLEMNTSGPRMAFSDFPIGDDDYPTHEAVREYFDRYVDHFGLRSQITFDTRVERVERRRDGIYEVEIAGEGAAGGHERRTYDAVLVANGHHWDRRWPEPPFPGRFEGTEMHAHDYRDPGIFSDKRVLVVGGGNSGMDIARDASDVAEATFLSLRRGVHVLRKRLGRKRKPIDQMLVPTWVPWWLKQKGFELFRRRSGDVSDLGLPEPDHRVGHAHPTVSDQIHDRLATGAVTPKPNIRELRGDRVLFEDGSEERVDLIVYCTGYRVTFPFFDEDFLAAPGNDLPLYRRTFHPEIDGLYFIGLAQPLGAIMPVAEAQGRWIADLLGGRYHLPSAEAMREDMRRERAAHARRFYPSPRHTMEIDFDGWMRDARRERRRGAKRAARAGNTLPIEPRAQTSAIAGEVVIR
jgi:dimethylaniline monooxygenase (N-oxide forming)